MAEDNMAKARAARAAKRANAASDQPDPTSNPRFSRTPMEREQARAAAAKTPADAREAQRIRVEQFGDRPFVGDSTGTHAAPTGKPKGRKFVVQHGAVGGFNRGTTVHESMFPEHTDMDRLLGLGAIKLADTDDGDDDSFEAAPVMTLTEATFSESPPTMPRIDGLDTTEEEMQDAIDKGVGSSGPRDDSGAASKTAS